jgi:hypothetical protein
VTFIEKPSTQSVDLGRKGRVKSNNNQTETGV